MTGPLPDDELLAMLQVRASRVSPDAERSALATFRATVRGASDGKGGFAVLPQALSSRGARLPWGVVALGVVAVVGVAIVGGQLSGTNVTASPSLAAATTIPAPATPFGDNAPDLVAAEALPHAIAAGSLARQIIVVNGRIAGTDCEPAVGCDYAIVGLPGVPVALGDDLVMEAPMAPAFDEASVLPYAFRVRDDGALVLLGVIPEGLTAVEQLTLTGPVGGLVMVDGWLVSRGTESDPDPCALPKPLPPECSTARAYFISGLEPGPDASVAPEHSVQVQVAPDARPGLFPPNGGDATFLVRRGAEGWRVEGRYAAVVPTVESPPSSPTGEATMTADQLRVGIGAGVLIGRVIVLDGTIQPIQVPCREPLACTVPTVAELGDISIAADPSLDQTTGTRPPAGPLVFVVTGDGLTFVGTASGPLDPPVSVRELAAADPTESSNRVRLVTGSFGIPLCLGGCPMSSTGPGPASWLSDPVGTGSPATVPVEVADPLMLRTDAGSRFLVRGRAATAGWIVVAVVGDQPIIRVSLP